ncbi:MAG: hypothetical protein PUC29_05445 [Clostridia bacterium]|nr:hypothetical protein [Clostridia bacterium]
MLLFVSLVLLSITPTHALSYSLTTSDNVPITSDFIINATASINDNVISLSRTTSIESNNYKCDTIYIIPAEGVSATYLLNELTEYAQRQSSNARGSISVEECDPSISVKCRLCTYFTRVSSQYGIASKVTSVSGGYRIIDRSVSVIGQSLIYGSTGKSSSTGLMKTQNASATPTTSSWSYTAPTGWHYIVETATHNIGSSCEFTLKRAGSTWSFTMYSIVSQG